MWRLWLSALSLALISRIGYTQQSAQQADAGPSAPIVDVKTITPPKPINNVDAEFSDEARRKRINGMCLVTLIVDANGMPQNPKVVRCSDPVFEQSSLDAVLKYRFKPATRLDGAPLPVMISVEVNYNLSGVSGPWKLIRYAFRTPPGDASVSPGADGVYPLTKDVTPPTLSKFSDEGYRTAAFPFAEKGACDVVLTISAIGKPSDPEAVHCETPSLEKSAVQSLLKSHYKPGTVNGKAVPVRAIIHLEPAGSAPAK